MLALRHFARHKELGDSPPINFLPPAQQGKILVVLGRVRASLYKVLLFQQAALAIKSGQLNFVHSYRYRAFESYLIPPDQWQRERTELLGRANLGEFMDIATVLDTLTSQLREQFKQTNERILGGQNAHVIRKKAKLIIQTPKTALDSLIQPYELFPANKVVSLQEVLSTVNRLTRFTNALTHWQPKHTPKRPPNNLFLAVIMALGCNVGVRRMAQITRSVSENSLDELVKWYCSLDNLRQANESVLLFTRELKLRIHLKDHPDVTYTSSDGRKMEVAQDSLLARPSFEYFGNRKGITAYNYTDDTMLLFDPLVFSAGDREATYLLNGLVNTRIVDSDVHSSDSHGATEPVFASTYLMGIHFEPRVKRLLYQQFYSIDPPSHYKDLNYPLIPRGRINIERIKAHWDTILRLMVTIKLHHSSPSDLFNRLNSYAHLHPVYQGLREFGRIIKTIFLLRYIGQVGVRQRIQRQLNRSESVHQLAKSVWFGRNSQMGWVNQAQQQIAETAKRLIMNCIICYNYLHISETLSKQTDRNERR